MDSHRFDNWTRNRALRISRRDALRLAGAGGITTAFATRSLDALAQPSCSLTIHGQTAGGPSAPATVDGVLQFSVGSGNAFIQASFTPNGGSPASASGSLAGRAIDVQIALGSGNTLALSGATDQKGPACPTAAAGILTGPQLGDLGAWQATTGPSTGGVAPPVSGQSSSSTSAGSTSGTNCPSPQTACGQNCCPSGAACTNANQGLCSCPNGTEQCGNQCVPSCSGGQSLDLDTCTCPPPEAACIQNQQTCQNHGQCCSGYCGGGTCFDCAGKVCGDFGCVDPNQDSQNCGNCGNVCIYPQVCANGVCGCAPDKTPCVDNAECCSQVCYVFNTCETCSNMTSSGSGAPSAPMTFCGPGICADLRIDIDHCGACFNSCPRTSGGIVCDTGVCHDINSDPNYCGFGALVCGPGKICHLGDCINA